MIFDLAEWCQEDGAPGSTRWMKLACPRLHYRLYWFYCSMLASYALGKRRSAHHGRMDVSGSGERHEKTMAVRNGRIFISHTTEDQDRIAPLVTRLTQKRIDCWTTISPGDTDTDLSPGTEKEIAERDVFLRICTLAALRSSRMRLEANSARAQQQEDTRNGSPNRHIMIDLVMDGGASSPDPADRGYLTIDTTARPMNDWLVVLYNEAGMMQAKRAMSRRTMTIVAVISVIFALLLLYGIWAFFALFEAVFKVG
jgi:hypothetical protein